MANKDHPHPKWVCGYRFGIDPVSGASLHHASFLLRHFLPLELVRDEAHQKMVEADLEEKSPRLIPLKDNETQLTVSTGSRSEGLGVPDYISGRQVVGADRDKMTYIPNWYTIDVPPQAHQYREGPLVEVESLEDGQDSKNYARLKFTKGFQAANLAIGEPLTQTYCSSQSLKEDMYKEVRGLFCSGNSDRYDVDIQGPSVSRFVPSLGPAMDRDECYSIAFDKWPLVAAEWITRHRPSGWPSKPFVEDLSSKGFIMVPVGRRVSPSTGYEWRYSFSLVERALSRSLPPVMRKVYVAIKMLHSFFLKVPGVLPSYAIKTLVFWFCETHEVNQWTEGDVASLVYCLLDEILHGLVRRTVRHYFIPCVNLLARAPPENILTLIKKTKYVRRNLIECLATIAKKVVFIGLLGFKSFAKLPSFEEFLLSVTSPLDETIFKRVCGNLLQDAFKEYVRLMEITNEEGGPGNIDLLRKAHVHRILRILQATLAEMRKMKKANREVSSFGEFLLGRLALCRQEEIVLARLFLWLYMNCCNQTRPDLDEIVLPSDDLTDQTPAEQQQTSQRIKKIIQLLKDGEVPKLKITLNNYQLFKKFYTGRIAATERFIAEHRTQSKRTDEESANPTTSGDNKPRRVLSGYRNGLDPSSGSSLQHLSFLLRYFLPIELVRDETQEKIIECDHLEYNDSAITTDKNVLKLITGSLAEGLAIPEYQFYPERSKGIHKFTLERRDKDEMVLHKNWYHMEGIPPEYEQYREGPLFDLEAVDGGQANYARLRVTRSFRVAKQEITKTPTKTVYLPTQGVKDGLLSIHQSFTSRLYPEIEEHGPCVTLSNKSFFANVDIDKCIAIAFKEWPEVASEWLTRNRPSGWPPQATVKDISQKGFCMVPVGRHNVEGAELEWRYSFSIAERILARSLPPIVRKAYILLKLLYSFYMKQPGVLPTYCLKTLLFWTCEEQWVSQWTESDMAGLLYCMLDRVMKALVRHEVRHYFIPEVNLLKEAPQEHVKTLLKKVVHLRRSLAESLVSITEQVSFHRLGGARFLWNLRSMKLFVKSMNTPTDIELFKKASRDLRFDIFEEYVDRIRSNEHLRETGQMGLMRQANRERYLRILYDIVLDMKETDEYRASFGEFLLSKLSMVRKDPLLLAKVFNWLQTYNLRHGWSETSDDEHGQGRATGVPLKKMLGKHTENHPRTQDQNNRMKEIQKHLPTSGVPDINMSTDSAEIYKRFHGQQVGMVLQPLIDLGVRTSLPTENKPAFVQVKQNPTGAIADPAKTLKKLFAQMNRRLKTCLNTGSPYAENNQQGQVETEQQQTGTSGNLATTVNTLFAQMASNRAERQNRLSEASERLKRLQQLRQQREQKPK